jgi:translation elongation factor EF-1alpha
MGTETAVAILGDHDSGKSSIAALLLIELGMIDKRVIEKLQQEQRFGSVYYSGVRIQNTPLDN